MDINIGQISDFLSVINVIIEKDRKEKEERQEKGESFVIFEELFFSRHEEQLHTPFIRMLLDSQGNHGLKNAFLKCFLEQVILKLKPNFKYDFNNSHIEHKDLYLGMREINDDGTSTGGKADIFLSDGSHHAIVIENKFDRNGYPANDQEKQLERYYNSVLEEYKNQDNFVLIYLTPKGTEPSEYSTGTGKIDYHTLSYVQKESSPCIISWLEQCVSIASDYPLIRETIKQYITYINNKTGIMNKENNDELYNVLLSVDNVASTLEIIDKGEEIYRRIRKDFCEQLIELAKQYSLTIDDNEQGLNALINWSDDCWIVFHGRKNKSVGFVIGNYLRYDKSGVNYGGVLYGLSIIDGSTNEELLNNEDFILKSTDSHELPQCKKGDKPYIDEKKDFPFGYSYLSDENKNWWDWSDKQTLIDMTNGKMLEFMKSRFEILKKHGILDLL